MEEKRAQVELQYRLSKWIVMDLVKNQTLTDTEATEILQALMNQLDPPTRGLERISFGKEDHQD